MQKSKIKLARLHLLLALTLTMVAGRCRPESQQNFFPAFNPAPSRPEPPQSELLLWLVGDHPGGGSYMIDDGSGTVSVWHDARGGTRGISAVGQLTGHKMSVPITTPRGNSYSTFALRCGHSTRSEDRCCYLVNPTHAPPGVLDGVPYTVLAVVRRLSTQWDNFFLMTNGRGCNASLGGGVGCERDSLLHLGWVGERELRLGQYHNDVTLDPSPAFNSSTQPLSLIVAVSAPDEGKTVALLEPTFNASNTVADTRPLANSNDLFIGGTAWGIGESQPNWRFAGDIFAILIYRKRLSPDEMRDAQHYLRSLYGPQ